MIGCNSVLVSNSLLLPIPEECGARRGFSKKGQIKDWWSRKEDLKLGL